MVKKIGIDIAAELVTHIVAGELKKLIQKQIVKFIATAFGADTELNIYVNGEKQNVKVLIIKMMKLSKVLKKQGK